MKLEGLNPTGSFKDRGMTAAVTQAVHEGSKAIICASTGNTSAAAAAYAARAGITAFVLIPEGKIALGKLNKFFKENTLLAQAFVKDNNLTVDGYLKSFDKDLTVTAFRHVKLG